MEYKTHEGLLASVPKMPDDVLMDTLNSAKAMRALTSRLYKDHGKEVKKLRKISKEWDTFVSQLKVEAKSRKLITH